MSNLAGKKVHGTRTQRSEIYGILRRDILNLTLPPGRRLVVQDLREMYNVGVNPLRDALLRLDAENLVVIEDNRGARVTPVSEQEFQDLYIALDEMWASLYRLSVANGDENWEANIIARLQLLLKRRLCNEEGEIDQEYLNHFSAFQETLLGASGYRWLLDCFMLTRQRFGRYLYIWASMEPRQSRESVMNFNAIIDAALKRDANTGIQVMRSHTKNIYSALIGHGLVKNYEVNTKLGDRKLDILT